MVTTFGAAMLLASLQTPQSDADSQSKHAAALEQCRATSDPAARLACYDRAVPTLLNAAATHDVVLIDRVDVRRARRKAFGFDATPARIVGVTAVAKEDHADFTRLETRIVSSRAAGNGKWRFTVTEGALWETLESDSGFNDPKPGATIIIERNAFGGFFAQVGRGRTVRARRIG